MNRLFDVVNQSITVVARDAAGAPVTGLVAADVTAAYRKGVAGLVVDDTVVDIADIDDAHTDWGWVELDDTLAPGAYRFDPPDAAFTSGAGDRVTFHLTATGAVEMHLEVELVPQVNVTVAGSIDANVTHAAGTAWLSGAIAAAAFAAGAITSTVLATDAIGAAELSNAAAEKIANEVLGTIFSDSTPFDGADIPLILDAVVDIIALIGTPAGASLAADIATRLASASYTTPPTTAQIADKIVVRNIAGGGDGTRTIGEALARLRNRVRNNAGTMEVYAANDTDILWQGALSTAAGNPISEVNPT